VLADTPMDIRITIFKDLIFDVNVYIETHDVTTNQYGMVNLVIGNGTPSLGTFSEIPWDAKYSYKVEFNTGGGFITIGIYPLQSVPYAMTAKNVWRLDGNNNTVPEEQFLGTTDDADLHIKTNNIDRLFIQGGANYAETKIGIHTTTPGVIPDLGIANTIGTFLHLNSTGDYSRILMYSEQNNIFYLSGIDQFGAHYYVNGNRDFRWHNWGGDPLMLLNSLGRLCVGSTVNPEAQLDVRSDNWHVRLHNEESPSTNHWNIGASSDGWAMGDGKFAINNAELSSTSKFVIESNGQTGIGTITPDYLLEVNGSAAKPGGGSWTSPSDFRLKHNVTPFTEGLSIITQIKPVSFHYTENTGFDATIKYNGVIAQELQEVVPAMVKEIPMDLNDGQSGSYLCVDPSDFTYLLINAVKELEEKNSQLEELIISMQSSISNLESRVNALSETTESKLND
jgi:hypothetical protein